MDQRLSRPDRWNAAVRRALQAERELQMLRDEWLEAREALVEKWNIQRRRFADAVGDLEVLKSEYSVWSVPDNLIESRMQEKLNVIDGLDFGSLFKRVPDLERISDPLEDFNPDENDDFIELYRAANVDLPKGYGRD